VNESVPVTADSIEAAEISNDERVRNRRIISIAVSPWIGWRGRLRRGGSAGAISAVVHTRPAQLTDRALRSGNAGSEDGQTH
jgi:hypothetical protein